MPVFKVTSPGGRDYNVELKEGTELTPEIKEGIIGDLHNYENAIDQSSLGAFSNSLARGAVSAIAEPIRGAGELFESPYLREAGQNLTKSVEATAPVSPDLENTFAAKAGSAIGQGGAQLGLAFGTGGLGLGARAVQASVLAPAFLSGAAAGADESRRLGIEENSASDKLNQVLYGGAEALSEAAFGLGSKAFSKELVSDAPNVLFRGARSTAAKRFATGVGQEAAEEPLAGGLQDFASRISAEFGGAVDPNESGKTVKGAELRSPFDLGARGEEALYGAIGALPFGGQAALRRNADTEDVSAYRLRVAKARMDKTIDPKNEKEVDDLDAKAASFLEGEGVPLMRNVAKSVVDGTAQGVTELNSIIADPATAPAAQAAAQAKLKVFQDQGKKILGLTDDFLSGKIPIETLRNEVQDYDSLNPFSLANQQKQLDNSLTAQAAAPAAKAVQTNLEAGNTATAAALIDTQDARNRATALRRQARTARKEAPQTAPPAPAEIAPATNTEVAKVAEDPSLAAAMQIRQHFDNTTNQEIPQLLSKLTESMRGGDFDAAATHIRKIEAATNSLGRILGKSGKQSPAIAQALNKHVNPQERAELEAKHNEAQGALSTVRATFQKHAEQAATPVATRAAQAVAPKPIQGDLFDESATPFPNPAAAAAETPSPVAENDIPDLSAEDKAPSEEETNAAFDELERARAEEQRAAESTETSAIEEPTPAPAEEPVTNPELAKVDEQIAQANERRAKALRRAQAARSRIGFFGGDPVEQAISSARLFKEDLNLGFLLLKKGYIRFKVWAREFIRETGGDMYSIRNLRKVYRMLRDNPENAAAKLNVSEEEVASLSPKMDAEGPSSKELVGESPLVKAPGFFGGEANTADWAGNTLFFEGRGDKKGAGRSHQIFVGNTSDGDLVNPSYPIVYHFENEIVPTGDTVSLHDGGWVFNHGAPAKSRDARFRLYTTTLLRNSFTETEDAASKDRQTTNTRRNWAAFNELVGFDGDGRITLPDQNALARWAASVRYIDGDKRYPVTATVAGDTVSITLSGTDTQVAVFHRSGEAWKFGEVDRFSKSDETSQGKFSLVGFDSTDSAGKVTHANSPAAVVAEWTSAKRYNVLEGFGAAPITPSGKRVTPVKREAAFKNAAELESWVKAKRLKQGHKLDINRVRRYVRERGPRSFRKYIDAAITKAEEEYTKTYPAEVTEFPVVSVRDNNNLGVQYARMVQGPLGLRPLFTNNVFETAVQINMGYRPNVPESIRNRVHPSIQVDPASGDVISASDSSGKVSNPGDHLAVRQRDPNVVAKSEARMLTEDEMNEALLDDFDFVDGLPRIENEDAILREATRKFASMRAPSDKLADRTLIEINALGNLFKQLRLEHIQGIVDATGYSANGKVVDETKLPAATAAVRNFIESRRQAASETRARLAEDDLPTRDVETVSVLPDRIEGLTKAAATATVLRGKSGINHGAYWNRALRRVRERYMTRVNSGFAAPVGTVQYNEEGSEQIDPTDEEQLAASLVEQGLQGDSTLTFDEVNEEDDSADYLNPEPVIAKPVQLDLFGEEKTDAAEKEDNLPPPEDQEEPELLDTQVTTTSLAIDDPVDEETLPGNSQFRISPAVATARNKNQRSMMRRILRGMPVEFRNAVFDSPTTDRFDRVMETYKAMRVALIRAGHLKSQDRPTFAEAFSMIFEKKTSIKNFERIFPAGTGDVLRHFARAHAAAPGIPNATRAAEVIAELGLVDGNAQSAIDALGKIATSSGVDASTRALASKVASLPGVQALQEFSMIPSTANRGLFIPYTAGINITPQDSTQATAETLLHEFTHLAVEQAVFEVESGAAGTAVQKAYDEITALREELARYARQSMSPELLWAKAQAFENNGEFLSYLFSDSAFNAWVSSRPQTFLDRVIGAIRRLLGLGGNTAVDKAWRATVLMSNRPAIFAQTAQSVDRDLLQLIIQIADGGTQIGKPLMAGVNAQNMPDALKESFAVAQEMDALGKSKNVIRDLTGWFRAPTDRQWRWELSDHGASFTKWTPNPARMQNWRHNPHLVGGALRDILDHPTLFAAYPEAGNIFVTNGGSTGPNGVFSPSTNTITLRHDLTGEDRMRTLIHEIQHWIQHQEGFFQGTNPGAVESMFEKGELSPDELMEMSGEHTDRPFFGAYRQWPGELEARGAASRLRMDEAERTRKTPLPWYPVRSRALIDKLRSLSAKGGLFAAEIDTDSGVSTSDARQSPAWYDSRTDTIYFNPDIIASETEGMTDKAYNNYLARLLTHEQIHRADFHTASQADYKAYGDALMDADFEWVANQYYVDPAEREYALGRAPGMSPEEKAHQRMLLIAEHRRAMIELALQGETTEQFAVFHATNPNLVARVANWISKFVAKLAARVKLRNYAGSARDLRKIMETLNNIVELDGMVDNPVLDLAEAKSVAVPIFSRRLGNYKVGGWGTTGFLNEEAAEAARVRDAKLRAMQTRVQAHHDDLASAVKKEYTAQGTPAPDSLINTALGSIENPVSPEQLAVAEGLRTRAVKQAVGKFLSQQALANNQSDEATGALIRQNAAKAYKDELNAARKVKEKYLARAESEWIAATRAKQDAAFAALLPETAKAVRVIRDDINEMQDNLLASGVINPKTAARISKTRGIYLTRSYQVYNENMVTATGVKRNLWSEFLRDSKDPKAAALLDAARAAIFEDAVTEKAKELRRQNTLARNPSGPFRSVAEQEAAIKAARKNNPPLKTEDALNRARDMLRSTGSVEVELLLEKYIDMGENMDSDTDVLKRRDNIHPAIQALWGVYEENEYNAYNTMAKINALLANQKMFQTIFDHGTKNGYIFDKEGVYVDGQRAVPLGGEGTQANRNRYGVLAGTYGPAELRAGLQETFGNAASTSSLWNMLRGITGYAMATKTKYSIQGTARNFVGNVMFAAINLNLHKAFDRNAYAVVARQLDLRTKDKTAYDNYIRRLIELRVVSESAYEFRELAKEFSHQMGGRLGAAIRGRKALEKTVAAMKSVDKFASRLHQGADDFWKVLSFEGELSRIKKWEPHLTPEQAEEKAAWKIRHTMPTYTEAFYFIKRLRQQPFIAPFITFTAEVYRTMFGTIKVGISEIRDGHKVLGMSRILNMITAVAFMPTLMAMLGRAAFGAGDDDKNPESGDEALSRFVPEYMRRNSLLRFPGKGGYNEQVYMDASYLLPQDVAGKVARATLDAFMDPDKASTLDRVADAGLAFLSEAFAPVAKEQLFFGAVMQAKFNYNQAYDRKIYKDTDTPWEITKAMVNHIYTSALEPGTLRTGRLVWEAADGVVRDGMKLEVDNEMLSVAGIKKRTIVLDTRFQKNADKTKQTLGEVAQYVTTPMQSSSTVSDEDISRGYIRANEERMNALRDARKDYLAALTLGMPQGKAAALLRDSQLSEDDVSMVVGNYYVPYRVSDQVLDKAIAKGKEIGQDRGRLYLDAFRAYPKRQVLTHDP